jgi:S-adenosylmethionine-dependent methyltransferase
MKNLFTNIAKKFLFTAPKSMQKRHITFNEDQRNLLRSSIEVNYLDRGNTKSRLSPEEYQLSIEGQLDGRIVYNRNRIVPWLNSVKSLEGAQVLEIGCGTGISTLALSEQGAHVVGIDVDQGALAVAKDRMQLAGFESELHFENAYEIKSKFGDRKFDFIIYYAVVEHMTIDERLSSLEQAWSMLSDGAFLAVIETPNRLWFYDSHTAGLPFYDWLPHDLAFYYSKFSGRKNFKDSYREINDEDMLKFQRWGRGASYHEFEVAIAPLNQLKVVSSLIKFEKTALMKCGLKGLRYIRLLKSLNRDLNSGFCYPYLDIILKK